MISRFSRDEDDEGILRLVSAAFDPWPVAELSATPLDHLRWKLRSHKLAMRFVGEIAGEIVVARMHVAQRLKVGERVLLSLIGVDYATLPQYQGLGLMSKLGNFGWDELLAAFDMSCFVESGHPGMQMLAVGDPAPRERFGDPVDVLTRDGAGVPGGRGSPSFAIEPAERFDERLDEFWIEASRPFDFMVVRDREFLNWRFDPRGGIYDIRLATEGGRMLGYLVAARSYGHGFIADLLVLPGRLDVLESLLRDALVRLRETGVESIRCWLPRRHAYRGVLERLGFRPRGRPLALVYETYRVGADELRLLHDPRLTVHYSMSDSDLV